MNELEPIEGEWYLNLDNEQAFEVISVDEDSGLIEIQYADGGLEEIDLDAWRELELEPTEGAEVWLETHGDADDIDYDEDAAELDEADELDEDRASREDEREESWKDEDD